MLHIVIYVGLAMCHVRWGMAVDRHTHELVGVLYGLMAAVDFSLLIARRSGPKS